jgi:hypothetical protein
MLLEKVALILAVRTTSEAVFTGLVTFTSG